MMQTKRLVLTKISEKDADKYYIMSCDENVMRFITGKALNRKESDEMLLKIVEKSNLHPLFGTYMVEDKESGELIGGARFTYEEKDQIEIGFRLLEKHWGKGYAGEIALKLIEFGKEIEPDFDIIAYVESRNAGSIRVLEKSGLKKIETLPEGNRIRYKYSLYKA